MATTTSPRPQVRFKADISRLRTAVGLKRRRRLVLLGAGAAVLLAGGVVVLQATRQNSRNPLEGRIFDLRFLAGAHLLFQSLAALFNLGGISQSQFQIDHFSVATRIH